MSTKHGVLAKLPLDIKALGEGLNISILYGTVSPASRG
jgi:hypothetical protein